MSKEPEDPNNNPWDVHPDDTKPKKSAKKTTDSADNPWANARKTTPFNASKKNNDDDLISSLMGQFKQFSNQSRNNQQSNNSSNSGGPNKTSGHGGIPTLGKTPPFFIVALLIGLALWLSTGIYRVQPGEVAIVLRFGRMLEDRTVTEGGLHYRFPFPIEQEYIKNVSEQKKIDSQNQNGYEQSNNFDKTLVLTGDENMVHINYTVLWNIKDVKEFLFSVRNPEETILAAAESTMREVMGQSTARGALTKERDTIAMKAQELLQKVLNNYKMGVQIVSVQLQRVDAPAEVINAFNDMQASLTDGDRMLHEANAYSSEIVPRARGEASKIIQDAEGYAREVTARAQGEADRFNHIYSEYKKNPEVARKRMYLDTMEYVLGRVKKTIVDAKAAPGLVPYYNVHSGAKAEKKQG